MGFFSSKKAEPPPPPKTLICQGTTVEGELISSDKLTIGGVFSGLANTSGFIEILPGGKFRGELNCGSVRCDGSGEGTVAVSGTASFGAASSWRGSFRIGALSVEKGANLQGDFAPASKSLEKGKKG